MTALMYLGKIYFSVCSHSLYFVFFFFSLAFPLYIFASTFLWAFYYKAKVTIMPLLCFKPNAPVCQRAQLCENK